MKSRDEVEHWSRAPADIQLLANQRGYAGGPTIPLGSLVLPPVLLRTPWFKGFVRRDPAVQQFPDLHADQSGRFRVARVKGRTVTSAQAPQLRVTVEDGLYEGLGTFLRQPVE